MSFFLTKKQRRDREQARRGHLADARQLFGVLAPRLYVVKRAKDGTVTRERTAFRNVIENGKHL